jgi:hypothetical protein
MQKPNIEVKAAIPDRITPPQIAAYAEEMLESLKKMTDGEGLELLSHLLGLAALEARHQSKRRL